MKRSRFKMLKANVKYVNYVDMSGQFLLLGNEPSIDFI
jgi:hypothetical protein